MILGTAREKWKETWITKQTSKMMRTNKENSKEQSQRRVHADGNPRAPADVSPDTERSCPHGKGFTEHKLVRGTEPRSCTWRRLGTPGLTALHGPHPRTSDSQVKAARWRVKGFEMDTHGQDGSQKRVSFSKNPL